MSARAPGGPVAFNYRYLVDRVRRAPGPVLDYGCGVGIAVALGLAQGLDIWGADTFQGHYAGNPAHILPQARERVRAIEGGVVPFPDRFFAAVFANQVLEHTSEPAALIAEVVRLLRPGGLFVCTYPARDTWYEGHVGLYFAHRLSRWPRLRRAYLSCCFRLGLGNYRDGKSAADWSAMFEQILDEVCFYYPSRQIAAMLETAFGAPVIDLGADYLRARLGPLARHLPRAADPLLRALCHIRAGQVLEVSRAPGQ